MEKIDITVIGAGVVGLAVAEKLSSTGRTVLLVEKNERFGMETSSRNSEVIHSGIYYPKNSLKAALCLEGNKKLYELCADKKIPHSRLGKIMVAARQEEIEPLEKFFDRGRNNGVEGLTMLTKREVSSLEPDVKAYAGLNVPSTGIIDTELLMKYLYNAADENGVMCLFSNKVVEIQQKQSHSYEIRISPNNEVFETDWVINTAGLKSDEIASLAGIDIDKVGYRLGFYKGEYYSLRAKNKFHFSRLVYPLPEGEGKFLGIHLTLNLKNQVRFGPSRYYVDTIDYSLDESYKKDFIKAINLYLPGIKENDIIPDTCGIRPYIGTNDTEFQDFIIQEETGLGFPGLINCIGIESPGLTAAPAIAEYIAGMIQ